MVFKVRTDSRNFTADVYRAGWSPARASCGAWRVHGSARKRMALRVIASELLLLRAFFGLSGIQVV